MFPTLELQYDHFSFPGSVPRTFVGALLLAGVSKPLIWFSGVNDSQFLGTFHRRAVREHFIYLENLINSQSLTRGPNRAANSCTNSPSHSRSFQCMCNRVIQECCCEVIRSNRSNLVHFITSLPIPCNLLCITDTPKHVRFWAQYVKDSLLQHTTQ